jgi:hypothetical protein
MNRAAVITPAARARMDNPTIICNDSAFMAE